MKSYEQFVEIMNVIAQARKPQSLTDIMLNLKWSKTTTFRALNSLTELQLLTRFDKKYSIGSKVLYWASAFETENALITAYGPYLKQLKDEFSVSINLYELDRDQLICIKKNEPEDSFCFRSRVGYSIPLYSTAAGKAILAAISAEERADYFQKTKLVALTTKTLTSQAQLKKQLDEFQTLGYAVESEENHSEFTCIGIALSSQGDEGKPLGALSLSSPIYTFTEEKKKAYIQALLDIKMKNIL